MASESRSSIPYDQNVRMRKFAVAGLLSVALIFHAALTIWPEYSARPEGYFSAQPEHAHRRCQSRRILGMPKDTSPEDLMKIMHGFTGQLGVECEFCHERDAAKTHKLNLPATKSPTRPFGAP